MSLFQRRRNDDSHTIQSNPIFISDVDLELIAYITLRSKVIPKVVTDCHDDDYPIPPQYFDAADCRFEFIPAQTKLGAKLILIPEHEQAIMHCSDEPGLDPFWDPSGMRLAEMTAIFNQAGYVLELHSEDDRFKPDPLYTKYKEYELEGHYNTGMALRKTAQFTGLKSLSEIKRAFVNADIRFDNFAFNHHVGHFLETGLTADPLFIMYKDYEMKDGFVMAIHKTAEFTKLKTLKEITKAFSDADIFLDRTTLHKQINAYLKTGRTNATELI